MARRIGLLIVVLLLVSTTAAAAPRHDGGLRASCVTSENLNNGWEAVFGRTAGASAAAALQRQVVQAGFANANVERDGCAEYEVEVPGGAGLDTTAQREGFRVEAHSVPARYDVSFEAPCCYVGGDRAGDWEAVLGNRSTLELATRLELRALAVGLGPLQIEQDRPRDYAVVLQGGRGFASAQGRAGFAAEARNSPARLLVTFERS